MEEIEVKILKVDRRQIEEKLVRLGANKVFDGQIESVFFDFKNHAIAKVRNLLRLRREDDKTILTFKKFLGNRAVKEVEEVEVIVSDIAKMKRILEFLGLSETSSMEKHRVSYCIDQVRFDIDKYKRQYAYIPEFLEIEAEGAETIHKYAKLLGFTVGDCLPWSTEELVKYYSGKTSK